MTRFPFIKVNQNDEFFYMTKMKVSFLKDCVDFHFRTNLNNEKDIETASKYIKSIEEKLGIPVKDEAEGIQRRTDLKRINDIAEFVKTSEGIIFSTPIVLSLEVFDRENYTINEVDNYFEVDDNVRFTIIDGQHRLAGLVKAFNDFNIDIEMPITLVIGADLSTASKLFIDINGNQRKVNKSMIYDLYENIDSNERQRITMYISAVKALNSNAESPLKHRIKMLGTGSGTISQLFMVDYLMDTWKKTPKLKEVVQEIFSESFIYFKIISMIYQEKWQMLPKMSDNSLLVKTNGIGALLMLLPELVKEIGLPSEYQKEYYNYFLKRSEFDWDSFSGTGKAIQRKIKENLQNFTDQNKS